MRFQIVHPNGILKHYVKHYCFMESDVCEEDITERVIPMNGIQLMFHYKNPFVVNQGNNSLKKQPRSILSGLSNSYSDVSTHGEAGVVFVEFYPTGACNFFNFPLSHLENHSVDLSDIFKHEISKIEEQLYFMEQIEERVNVIENFLLKKFSPISSCECKLLQRGVELIQHYKGQIIASALADQLAITPKSLERKFSQYLGKTPKQYIKLIRYRAVLTNLTHHKNTDLTELAYLNGYFDQSHFIRDFKSFTGYTPKQFKLKYSILDLNTESC